MSDDDILNDCVSEATKRNWVRLDTDDRDRLTARANKRRSVKRIIPMEYISNSKNIPILEEVVSYIRDNNLSVQTSLYSVGVSLLQTAGIIDKCNVRDTLKEYEIEPDAHLCGMSCPSDEADWLGVLYQCLMTEGHKNIIGSYYTPPVIVSNMTGGLDFSAGQTFLDPSCGSGAFLLSLKCDNPDLIYGVDSDPIAVMICRINLLLKYRTCDFTPHIYIEDFLSDNVFADTQFDYIMTNPPWGAMSSSQDGTKTRYGETFSAFFIRSFEHLRQNGIIRFLFPYAVLNVQTHKMFRQFMIRNAKIHRVTVYDETFSGVVTKCVDIECHKSPSAQTFEVLRSGTHYQSRLDWIDKTHGCVFGLMTQAQHSVTVQAFRQPYMTLDGSQWALGIVTGGNSKCLHKNAMPGDEPIYTGKDVGLYTLSAPQNYIGFEPEHFQQTAPVQMYRAKEKLIYRFISSRPIFAYDDSGSITLNSANILIPRIPGMSVKTVMAFLNSDLFSFLYRVLFGEIKILQSSLRQLPFVHITAETDSHIADVVDDILHGQPNRHYELQPLICELYGLAPEQADIVMCR